MVPSGPGMNPHIESVTTHGPVGESLRHDDGQHEGHERDGREHGRDDEPHVHYVPAAGAARRCGAREGLVDQVRAAIEKYKDYKKAIADGYIQAIRRWTSLSSTSPTMPTRSWPTPVRSLTADLAAVLPHAQAEIQIRRRDVHRPSQCHRR